MTAFAQETAMQCGKNIKKWGRQNVSLLLIALGEEYGEICKAFLQGSNLKEEVIHAAALLQALYEEAQP